MPFATCSSLADTVPRLLTVTGAVPLEPKRRSPAVTAFPCALKFEPVSWTLSVPVVLRLAPNFVAAHPGQDVHKVVGDVRGRRGCERRAVGDIDAVVAADDRVPGEQREVLAIAEVKIAQSQSARRGAAAVQGHRGRAVVAEQEIAGGEIVAVQVHVPPVSVLTVWLPMNMSAPRFSVLATTFTVQVTFVFDTVESVAPPKRLTAAIPPTPLIPPPVIVSPATSVTFWPLARLRELRLSVPGVPLPRFKVTEDVRKEPDRAYLRLRLLPARLSAALTPSTLMAAVPTFRLAPRISVPASAVALVVMFVAVVVVASRR